MSHGRIHALLAKGELSPSQAADLVMKSRSKGQQPPRLLGTIALFLIVCVSSILGLRQTRT